MPRIAARNASRPMRPIPLMPTLITILPSWCYTGRIADFIQACLERHPIERRKGEAGEYLKAPANHGVQLIQQRRAFRCRTVELGRVRERPGGGHELASEVWAKLAVRGIAKRDNEIHARRIR